MPETVLTTDEIAEFYDEFGKSMVTNYVHGNPRINMAVDFVADSVPKRPLKALDLGCAIGVTTFEIARCCPHLSMTGVDISPQNIAVASALFAEENIRFHCSCIEDLSPEAIGDRFDVITMIDMYEHVRRETRTEAGRVLNSLLSDNGLLLLTVPSELNQVSMHTDETHRLQIVDEVVSPSDASELANWVGGELMVYKHVSVWRTNDYVHILIARNPKFERLERSISLPNRAANRVRKSITAAQRKRKVKETLGIDCD